MLSEDEKKKVLEEIFELRLLQKFDDEERLPVIDAFSQFSQNPTSATAGYGVEENYPYIDENLRKRYNLGNMTRSNILSFLKDSIKKMRETNCEIYVWRDAVRDYIRNRYTELFLQWFESSYEKLNKKEKQQFLFLMYALHYTNSIEDLRKWFTCFFDKEEKLTQYEIKDRLVRLGLGNILYYRSAKGHVSCEFVPFHLLDVLRKRFEERIPVKEKKVERFFETLTLETIKLLEKCLKEPIPVLENKMERITQNAPLIVENSKSYFGISPFALDKIEEMIKAKKVELTKEWRERFNEILTTFIGETYPLAELKSIFDIEGAYCWEIRYAEAPEGPLITVTLLLAPYLFSLDRYSTILDEMKRMASSPLTLIFLIKETLPNIMEAFRYTYSQRNFIFFFEEKVKKFYVIERSGDLPKDVLLVTESFLSKFLPFLEKRIQISMTLSTYLKDYFENIRYFNQFPRLVLIRNKILNLEPKLRESIREKLRNKFGDQWKEKVSEKFPEQVKKWKNVIESRSDKNKAKDFLDGTTLGELVSITSSFPDIFELEENIVKGFLNLFNKHRKVLEHPFTQLKEDLEETTYKELNIVLEYIENVVCSK